MTTCKDEVDYVCDDCTDAWDLYRNCQVAEVHPISSADEVSVGNCVEVNQGGERFWLKVLATCTCFLIGRVMTDLVFPHPFSKGDTLKVTIQQVYNVERKGHDGLRCQAQ